MNDPLYTRATTSGLLTATGAETVYDTTVAISYSIGGKGYSKAAVTDGATPTTDADGDALTNLGASEGCVLVWALNAAGTVVLIQSEIGELDSGENFKDGELPGFPYVDLETYCPFAYMVLKAGSDISGSTSGAGVFDIGTDNWNSTGLTVTIVNVHTLPRRPQSS